MTSARNNIAGTETMQPQLYATPTGASHGYRVAIPSGMAEITIDNEYGRCHFAIANPPLRTVRAS